MQVKTQNFLYYLTEGVFCVYNAWRLLLWSVYLQLSTTWTMVFNGVFVQWRQNAVDLQFRQMTDSFQWWGHGMEMYLELFRERNWMSHLGMEAGRSYQFQGSHFKHHMGQCCPCSLTSPPGNDRIGKQNRSRQYISRPSYGGCQIGAVPYYSWKLRRHLGGVWLEGLKCSPSHKNISLYYRDLYFCERNWI
mgnify:CR=1 FL=1